MFKSLTIEAQYFTSKRGGGVLQPGLLLSGHGNKPASTIMSTLQELLLRQGSSVCTLVKPRSE